MQTTHYHPLMSGYRQPLSSQWGGVTKHNTYMSQSTKQMYQRKRGRSGRKRRSCQISWSARDWSPPIGARDPIQERGYDHDRLLHVLSNPEGNHN